MYISPKVRKRLAEYNFKQWIDTPLVTDEKELLCKELNLPTYNIYDYAKWQTVKLYLIEFGYKVEDDRIYIDGVRTRVSIISL